MCGNSECKISGKKVDIHRLTSSVPTGLSRHCFQKRYILTQHDIVFKIKLVNVSFVIIIM